MIIKSDLRSLIYQMTDDPQQAYWSETLLDLLTEQVMDALWAKIHDYLPFFTSQTDGNLTCLSPGYIDLRQVGVGTGQLTNRFHKLQSVIVGNAMSDAITYEAADPRDVVVLGGTVIYAPNYRYVFYNNNQLWLFPLDLSVGNQQVMYSYKPTPAYRQLADSSTIGWPDGHEKALWMEVAAMALSKAAREDPNIFRTQADDAFLEMISSIKNQSIGPQVVWTGDASETWGST